MKRLLHSVAALMIGLVGLQPAVGLLCHAPAAPCPLAFSDTGPHCGAVNKADLDGSRSTPQVRPVARSMASVALPATRKAVTLVAADAPSLAVPARATCGAIAAVAPARAESPPIFLRNRVFRI